MERRRIARVPLDVPFFVTVQLDSGEQYRAMLVDCGRGGVQLAFSPTENSGMDALLNQPLILLGLPQELGVAPDGCPGMVIWVSPERCGVRFDVALTLTDEELAEVTGTL